MGQAMRATASTDSTIFLIHGPGGVGKTALLAQARDIALQAHRGWTCVDARDTVGTVSGLVQALARALGVADPEQASLAQVMSQWRQNDAGPVLAIDTFEQVAHLEGWLRDHVIADMPAGSVVILAGRQRPDRIWLDDPLWRHATRCIAMTDLSTEDTSEWLHARGIAPALQASIMALTYGHPLALTLVADIAETTGSVPERLDRDLIQRLTDCLVAQAPSARHRDALMLSAMARATTEDLLAELLDPNQAPALFEWLRAQSFMQVGAHGVFPHDLVRDAVCADSRWRAPDAWRHLARKLTVHQVAQVQGSGTSAQRAVTDLFFLQHLNPVMQRFFDFSALGSLSCERVSDDALMGMSALMQKEAGSHSAKLCQRWHRHPANHSWVVLDSDRRVVAALLCLDLAMLSPAEIAHDPGLASAQAWLRRQAPLKPGDKALCARMMVAEGGHLQSMAHFNALQSCVGHMWLSVPRLALFLSVTNDVAFWGPMMTFLDFHLIDEPPFDMDGHLLHYFAHDWRDRPLPQWLDLMASRTAGEDEPAADAGPTGCARSLLSRSAFEQALREALQRWHDAPSLRLNPLLQSRLVLTQAGQGPEADPLMALRTAIQEVLSRWQLRPADRKFQRALELTYLRPVGTQELAAERLGLPFGTYRYQLRQGVIKLADALWAMEATSG